MDCDGLLVLVDHKPLAKLLSDRRLDDNDKTMLFRIKQRTLIWTFLEEYRPGIHNYFADAVSQHPTKDTQDEEDFPVELIFAGIRMYMDHFFGVM